MGALIEPLPFRYDCNDDYDTTVSSGTQGQENKQAKEAIQDDGQRRTPEHCVPCVVEHYPVGIWLMVGANTWEDDRLQHAEMQRWLVSMPTMRTRGVRQ
ncbi:hypothetical protein TNCV_4702061 [Trichonephila clavipes]|uniref:Uncharacterized protein n=1 Tax=Trichonephila clavipes TaxID=2585209 RepID=A0A8X7BKM3_TRICX|nr:hypothetical protein TNCV_4702061 [Trichonephila clavipes]